MRWIAATSSKPSASASSVINAIEWRMSRCRSARMIRSAFLSIPPQSKVRITWRTWTSGFGIARDLLVLTSLEQARRQLLRIELRVAVDLLEPKPAVHGELLQALHSRAAFGVVAFERGSDVAAPADRFSEADRVLERDARSGSDREVNRARRVSDQRHIPVREAL